MNQGYLAQESLRVNRATRKMLFKAMIVLICALSVLYFLGKDSINFKDISYGSISFYLVISIGLIIFCSVIKIIATGGDGYPVPQDSLGLPTGWHKGRSFCGKAADFH